MESNFLNDHLKILTRHIRSVCPEEWADRPILFINPARRISYAPKENSDEFNLEALAEFEDQKRENPQMAAFFKEPETEIWYLDISGGLPPGFHDKIVNALEDIEHADTKLGEQRPDGYVISLIYCPPENDPDQSAIRCRTGLNEIRNGDFDRFVYELATLVDCTRPGEQKKPPVCFGKPALLNFSD